MTAVALALAAALVMLALALRTEEPRSFEDQACSLPGSWLTRIQRGYHEPRSGQISLLPRYPAYMASGGAGWSHSGPWPYLQEVPLVFYSPGLLGNGQIVDREVTLADLAPTTAELIGADLPGVQGRALTEVVDAAGGKKPKLIVTVVWDGGGRNALELWPDTWPNLARLMDGGISYTNATDGSSPSVTPAVHSTIGTGVFPEIHGVTGVPVLDEEGDVVDAFLNGESSRFLEVPTVGELWDEQNDNRAKIGMLAYEPWHLGMIGHGAERPGGDKDDAVWLNVDTNEWITNPDHYRLPPSVEGTTGLAEDIARLDAADGRVDRSWGDLQILDDRSRIEETPAFVHFHGRALRNMITEEGYGDDDVTDLLYTNFKQIDRIAHYYNMADRTVGENLQATDEELGALVDYLDQTMDPADWMVVVTADHGMQPDQAAVDGFGINPREVEDDIDAHFGAPIAGAVWPTEVFLFEDEMESAGITTQEVARYLANYRVSDNAADVETRVDGTGVFEGDDTVYEMAIPAAMLPDIDCDAGPGAASGWGMAYRMSPP